MKAASGYSESESGFDEVESKLGASSGIQELTPPLKLKTFKAAMIRAGTSRERPSTSKSFH